MNDETPPPQPPQEPDRPRRRRPRRRGARPALRGLSINHIIPNLLTMAALAAGLTAVRMSLEQRWELAVASVGLAAVLDGLDGRIARLLNGSTKFGAELDSLSDFISFGVAPALVLYSWSLSEAEGLGGWAVALLYAAACSLRLARFNTMLGEPNLPPWAYNFFQGVPAPAGAGLALLPMVFSFHFDSELFRNPWLVGAVVIGSGMLQVSSIPTFSFKGSRIPHWQVPVLLLAVGAVAAFMVSAPWATLGVLGIMYLGSIPFSLRAFRRLRRQAEALRADEDGEDDPD